ncbi:MAG: N-acetylmuramoyl-L-alanine amidase [Chloroflexota bacterium]
MTRLLIAVARCALFASLIVAVMPSPAWAQQADARMFSQTGYRIGDDAIWIYFRRRGGVRTFGYPVSNPFTLQGFRVQIFQRAILQMQPNGAVAIANVLDDGLLPYTAINGSNFPGPDPDLIARQPRVGEPDYHQKALQFVRDNAPDTWQGVKVSFFQTFSGAVRAEEAFPDGGASDGLLLGFNLEVWGLPTSRPTPDPNNNNFVYQRFQRGIMHYDASCKCTQGLLLADYLKSILTLRNLPPDLAAQAQRSPFYGQVDPGLPRWLRRPGDLPGSDLTDAFAPEVAALTASRPTTLTMSQPPESISPNPGGTPTPAAPSPPPAVPTAPPSSVGASTPGVPGKGMVFVDAGHGGAEIGASARFDDGRTLIEKDLNLRVATRLAALLRDAGIGVAVSRTVDAQVNTTRDLNNDTKVNLTDDLQARVDAANASKADVMVAVHFNGIDDPTKKGTQTFYSEGRPFSDRNRALAELVQASLVRNIRGAGYNTDDRGPTSDSRVLGQGSHYYLLGPESPTIRRASQMPAVIGEALFLTNPDDARALSQDKVVESVARGYFEAIKAYLDKFPPK